MTSSNSQPSYFQAVFGKPVNVVWFLRALAVAALTTIILAEYVWTSGRAHNFCLGLATGILIGLLVQTSLIKKIELNENQHPSDVNPSPSPNRPHPSKAQ